MPLICCMTPSPTGTHFKIEVDGEVKEMTRGELMVYARHHDADLRAKAYQELYRVYGQDGPILGQMYQAIVRNWSNEQVNLRHFSSPIASRNLVNDIPDEVVDTLLSVSQENAVVFHGFSSSKRAGWVWKNCAGMMFMHRWRNLTRLFAYEDAAPFRFPILSEILIREWPNWLSGSSQKNIWIAKSARENAAALSAPPSTRNSPRG